MLLQLIKQGLGLLDLLLSGPADEEGLLEEVSSGFASLHSETVLFGGIISREVVEEVDETN